MKRFAYLSFGILCLAVSALIVNHITTPKADAQAGGQIVGYSTENNGMFQFVITTSGDVYKNTGNPSYAPDDCHQLAYYPVDCGATYIGNFWTGTPPVGTSSETWGKVKSLYKPK